MSETWSEWAGKKYNNSYNSYVPWLEDKYLAWYGENKTSYTAKGQSPYPFISLLLGSRLIEFVAYLENLKQNPLTDDKNVAAIQGGVADGVGGQLSSGGLLGGVGDMSSKEGVNRVERGELDPSQLDEIKKKEAEKQSKGWTETMTGGYFGGSQKK